MEQLLIDYSTPFTYWELIRIAAGGIIALLFFGFTAFLIANEEVLWSIVPMLVTVLGVALCAPPLDDMGSTEQGLENWNQGGVFVEDFGFLDSPISDEKVKLVREEGEAEVLEVTHLLDSCERNVYLLKTNGELTVCMDNNSES